MGCPRGRIDRQASEWAEESLRMQKKIGTQCLHSLAKWAAVLISFLFLIFLIIHGVCDIHRSLVFVNMTRYCLAKKEEEEGSMHSLPTREAPYKDG